MAVKIKCLSLKHYALKTLAELEVYTSIHAFLTS
jgi:hypothetical protein